MNAILQLLQQVLKKQKTHERMHGNVGKIPIEKKTNETRGVLQWWKKQSTITVTDN